MRMNHGGLCLLVLATASLISGCFNLRPELVKPPTKEELEKAGSAMYTGPVNGSIAEYKTYTDHLAAWHQKKAQELYGAEALGSETSFLATVTSVVSAATGHLQAAKSAAVIAGGGALISDRYKITVQAGNYDKASKSFLCMRDRLAAADAVQNLSSQTLRTTHPEVEIRLPDTMRAKVGEVLDRLATAQRQISIVTPDIENIKKALSQTPTTAAVSSFRVGGASLDTTPIDELLKNIAACAAQF